MTRPHGREGISHVAFLSGAGGEIAFGMHPTEGERSSVQNRTKWWGNLAWSRDGAEVGWLRGQLRPTDLPSANSKINTAGLGVMVSHSNMQLVSHRLSLEDQEA